MSSKRRIAVISVMMLAAVSFGAAASYTTVLDISTESGFNDWINNSSGVNVTSDSIDFNSSETGFIELDKFEVDSHENLTINLTGTTNGTVKVEGVTNDSVNDTKTFNLSDGEQTFNTTGLSGDFTRITVNKTEADSNKTFNIERIAYKGTLPDDGTIIVGGSSDNQFMGVDYGLIVIVLLLVLAIVVYWADD